MNYESEKKGNKSQPGPIPHFHRIGAQHKL